MTFYCIVKFINMVKNYFDKKIKIFRSDNNGEFTSENFKKLTEELGIIQQFSCPYTPI